MFGIGDFAALGRVSVRMLRHYDAIGLIRPARVDEFSGYRYYTAAQLPLLNRVIALKDLGFTLQQVQVLIDEKVDPGELRGMLRLRRAQLAEEMAAGTARLALVDARLRMIETEGHMDTGDVILKNIPAVRVAELSAPASSYDGPDITTALSPLYPQLIERLESGGVTISGPPMAYYLPDPHGPGDESITVHAAFPITGDVPADPGFQVVDLPAVERAATLLHHGPMSEAFRTGQLIANWIDDSGYQTVGSGYAREIYLDCPMDDLSKWITEMQVAVAPVT
ncbi:MerR family transcriptional regulator [Amorphoplanes digitatis]|uniref:DNA-binding transcriptional MerR regulator/effector-binding domain-containing protein n=1 Tax=Actinoplanes digitatis TaxID=1868 RepID=A0A7W7I3H8_9ACTN|nr:MerR family transcriptional regulator [Actinoplanes digitatis]MBB4765734.1 DNA-binding transcriptional MerR regulator/effector-binding domain-containing protein [Actinoplanes digitatis]GID98485.1 MerR family transcriptional regulator [Actinoplanes digitatis]